MSTSLYIARLMGPVLLVMGLGMVVEHETVSRISGDFLSNLSLIYLAGILTLLAGLVIVNAHNLWIADWRVIITVFGWLAVIGGVLRILLPSQVQTLGAGFAASAAAIILGGVVTLVLGAFLSWMGYEPLLREAQWSARPTRARASATRRAAKRGPARKAGARSRKGS